MVRVSPLALRAPVYNLTVSGQHEYFANGVLVSNCDTLRYLCATGMRYVPHDRLQGFLREQELQLEEVKMAEGIESRRYKHLMNRYLKERNLSEPPMHVGGLGSDY